MADQAHPIASLELPAALFTTVVLVRHGESTFVAEGRFQGRQDPPLSELGERQAMAVAERLANRSPMTPLPIPDGPPAAVFHSPLKRAADTARAIAERQPTDVPLRPIDQLTEIAQGDWEGMPLPEVKARWTAELAAWRRTPAQAHAPGGEPLIEAAERVRAGLAAIIDTMAPPQGWESVPDRLPHDPVLGYGAAVAGAADPEPWIVVVAHDGIFRLALINLLGLPLERFWAFPFNLASITVITVRDGAAALRAHNLAEHMTAIADGERLAQEMRGDRRGAL